ncbi:helix-turn-helix transcriptional regulator [Ralstonia solanacearum]|uniref:helix-turn-helix transcriptional regulator n=1 Tax=Ralstonia solanacearum TaxID=305 RepID=UPI00399D6900
MSLRTIRRDVATLQGMGADIDAEPEVGYLLRPGFVLPPLSFTEEEIQALVIGAQWVSRQTDDALALAVKNALAKIYAVLPSEMRVALDDDTVYVGHPPRTAMHHISPDRQRGFEKCPRGGAPPGGRESDVAIPPCGA